MRRNKAMYCAVSPCTAAPKNDARGMHGVDATPPSGCCLTVPGLPKKTCFFNLFLRLWVSYLLRL